jgi:hypothetical protein
VIETVVSQTYPPNFQNNGCSFRKLAYTTPEIVTCKEVEYRMVLHDNFNDTVLNPIVWQTYYPWGYSLKSEKTDSGWERQIYTSDNVSVRNGYLVLKTVLDPGYRIPEFGKADKVFFRYTSGLVLSQSKYKKGKFEIRCKIPRMNGMFPAFWLSGDCFQEIDVFEFTNSSETSDPQTDAAHVIMTNHRNYDCANEDNGVCHYAFVKNTAKDMSADFHNYSVEWNEYRIVWKIDDVIAREVYKLWKFPVSLEQNGLYDYPIPVKSCADLEPKSRYAEFDAFPDTSNHLHIIMNSAVLKDRASEPGALPVEFIIDYIKAYEEVETGAVSKNSVIPDFQISPNPARNTFTMPEMIYGEKINEIIITDMNGNVANYTFHRITGKFSFHLISACSGIYLIQIGTETNRYYKKLILL